MTLTRRELIKKVRYLHEEAVDSGLEEMEGELRVILADLLTPPTLPDGWEFDGTSTVRNGCVAADGTFDGVEIHVDRGTVEICGIGSGYQPDRGGYAQAAVGAVRAALELAERSER